MTPTSIYGEFPRSDAEAYEAMAQAWEGHMLRDADCLPVTEPVTTGSPTPGEGR